MERDLGAALLRIARLEAGDLPLDESVALYESTLEDVAAGVLERVQSGVANWPLISPTSLSISTLRSS